MTPLTVADTTVLSNFAVAGAPELLATAFPGISSPPAVKREMATGQRLGYLPEADWGWLGDLPPTAAESDRARELGARLGAGESECIAIAEARGALLLTDDRAARRACDELKVRVSGTLARISHQASLRGGVGACGC